MVHGDVDVAARGLLDRLGHAPTAGELIYQLPALQPKYELWSSHHRPPFRHHFSHRARLVTSHAQNKLKGKINSA